MFLDNEQQNYLASQQQIII